MKNTFWIIPVSVSLALHSASGGSNDPLAFASIQATGAQLVVTLSVPSSATRVLLESRSDLENDPWKLEAVQTVTNGGPVTFRIPKSQPSGFLSARIETATPTYLGGLLRGYDLVKSVYTNALFYTANSPLQSPTTDPHEIREVHITCMASGGAAFTSSTNLTDFTPVTFYPQPIVGNDTFPLSFRMNVVDADALLKSAGYTGAYRQVELRMPLYPEITEPFYFFSMTNSTVRSVGVYSRQVY